MPIIVLQMLHASTLGRRGMNVYVTMGLKEIRINFVNLNILVSLFYLL